MEQLDLILEKANICLNCKKPMCKLGCPISTNIPEFIQEIKLKNFENAYNILQENNMLSEICSTVCPVEDQCMGKCVRGIKGIPIQINVLERYVDEWATDNKIEYKPEISPNCNKKVAIIGSGPAGLACAIDLAKEGASVTIFEKEEKCGGILTYGIPDFRLSKKVVNEIIERIKDLGIVIRNNVEFGNDITIDELHKQGFDEIFIGVGAQKQTIYSLGKENISGIYKSDEFLKKYCNGEKINNLGTTIVIGGGNVAIDSARVAVKQGAEKVYIVYRRNKELMPARKIEIDEAIKDGVEFIYQTKVIAANEDNKRVQEIECIKTRIENNKAVEIENSNFKMKANTVIFAIGASLDIRPFENSGIKYENGLVCVDENYKTNIEGVYAGGDAVETKSTVCRAIETGKKVAKEIIKNSKI